MKRQAMPPRNQILTVAQMQAAEQALIDGGETVSSLMKRAGAGAADYVWRLSAGRPVTVLCGPGNNGGDGYVIARVLRERGVAVQVVAPLEPRTAAARAACTAWGGEPVEQASGEVFVDCLFGSGLARSLDPAMERLLADLQQAMRTKDVPRREAIRMVRAAIQNSEIALQRPLTEQEIQDLIAREIKRRNEALELFRKGGRQDLVAEEEAGLRVLAEYLPRQLSQEEIAEIVRGIVRELGVSGPAAVGQVMRAAMAQLKGRADGRLINEVVRQVLAQ